MTAAAENNRPGPICIFRRTNRGISASATPHAGILEEAKGPLKEKGTHLTAAGEIHYEPFGIYAGTKKSLDDIKDGDSIAIPNDTTNEARALLLLQDNGIIKLKDGAGYEGAVIPYE